MTLRRVSAILIAAALLLSALPFSVHAQSAADRLKNYLSAGKVRRRAMIIEASSHKDDKHSARFLRMAFFREEEVMLRKSIATALFNMGSAAAISALVEVANKDDKEVRKELFKYLSVYSKKIQFAHFAARALGKKKKGYSRVKILVLSIISNGQHPGLAKTITGALRDKDEVVRIMAIGALSFSFNAKTLRALGRMLSRGDTSKVEIAIVRLLAGINSEDSAKTALKALRSKHPEVVVEAVDSIFMHKFVKNATREAVAIIGNDNPQIREAAIRLIQAYSDKEAVKTIISNLKKALPPKSGYIIDAIKQLTGIVRKDWAGYDKWYKLNKDGFTVMRDKVAGPAVTKARKATYFGTSIESDKLIFIIDTSMSMREKYQLPPGVDPPRKPRTPRTAVDPEGPDKKPIDPTEYTRKIDVARDELLACVEDLDDDIKFNVISYHTLIFSFREKLVPAKRFVKHQLLLFAKKLEPNGMTNLFGALERALKDPEVTCIYLLSDGEPTEGRFIKPSDILREVKKLNKRNVQINTIGFGLRGEGEALLKNLAAQNDGKFIKR